MTPAGPRWYSGLVGAFWFFTLWSLIAWAMLIWHIWFADRLEVEGRSMLAELMVAGGALDVTATDIRLRVVIWNLLILGGVLWLPLALLRLRLAQIVTLGSLAPAFLMAPLMRSIHFLGLTTHEASTWPLETSERPLSFFDMLLVLEWSMALIALVGVYFVLFRSARARQVFS